MSDDRAQQWTMIEQRVEHHRRARWHEIQRWDDPPRVRVRKQSRPRRLPLGQVAHTAGDARPALCRDIMLGDDGTVIWPNVDCGSD